MQRKLARLFLVIFLMQITQLSEVARLPLLVQHYIQHKHLHPETTICGFFKMHYLDNTVDADYAQDIQLPFKTAHIHFNVIQLSMPPAVLMLRSSVSPAIIEKIAVRQHRLPNASLSSIFQPPKIS
jgi:hypothetical protein